MNIKPISFCAAKNHYKPFIKYNKDRSNLFDVIKFAYVYNKNGELKEKAEKIQGKTVVKRFSKNGLTSKIKSGEDFFVAGYLEDKNELYTLGEPQNVKYYNALGDLEKEIDIKKSNESYILNIKEENSDCEIYQSNHDAWITYKDKHNKSSIYLTNYDNSGMKIKSKNCTPECMEAILKTLKETLPICRKENMDIDFSQYIELLEDELNQQS